MGNAKIVKGSIEFRDAVMELDKGGHRAYAKLTGSMSLTYRIIPTLSHMTINELFVHSYPPVMMEDFATALIIAERDGELPLVEVFSR